MSGWAADAWRRPATPARGRRRSVLARRATVHAVVFAAAVAAGAAVLAMAGREPATAPAFAALEVPQRVLDTRTHGSTVDGRSFGTGPVGEGRSVEVPIAGRGGIPREATSVILTVTAVDARSDGYLAVHACAISRPETSNVNFRAGQTVVNAALVRLSPTGHACLTGSGTTDAVVDVVGHVDADVLHTLPQPARLADTRRGGRTVDGRLAGPGQLAGRVLRVPAARRAGLPADVEVVVLNVTAVDAIGHGTVTVHDCEAPAPAPTLHAAADSTIATMAVADVGSDGDVCVTSSVEVDLVVDVAGYTTDQRGLRVLLVPERLLDTRAGGRTVDGQFEEARRRAPDAPSRLRIAGRGSVPEDASSVVLTVTATDAAGPGFVTVHPSGTSRPDASHLDVGDSRPLSTTVVVPVGAAGDVCLAVSTETHLVVDVVAFVHGTSTPRPAGRTGCD